MKSEANPTGYQTDGDLLISDSRIQRVIDAIGVVEGMGVHQEWTTSHGLCLRVVCNEGTCNVTGKSLTWKGRRWPLSVHMTDGEIVQTAFLAVMTAMEHEVREKFTYKGVSVFDPHYDIDKLVELRSRPDALKEREDSRTTAFVCPIAYPGCTKDCGAYGCGN